MIALPPLPFVTSLTAFPTLLAEGALRSRFEWGRIQSNADWVLPILVCVALLLFARYMIRRDSVELSRPWSWMLTLLRSLVILALFVFFLNPHWRWEREMTRPSRAVVLVDTSMSMGLSDSANGPVPSSSQAKASRLAQIAAMFKETDFLAQLRKKHDVSIFQFHDDLLVDRSLSLPKLDPANPANTTEEKPIDWDRFFQLGGSETRLGQALRQLIHNERGSQLSGMILMSDGGQNAGISPDAAVSLAQERKLPIFTVGLGSEKQPSNVRVSDLAVPTRAYPGDKYSVTGYLQAQHMAGKVVTVEILGRPADTPAKDEGTGTVLESRTVTLGNDGEVVPVKFELTPSEIGRRTLCFRVPNPPGDTQTGDNYREAEIEIVERKNHVLLFAGGPMRDYHFLRTLLFRDATTSLDVLLQTAQEGMSQEGKVIDEFPKTREQMFDYDCIVAFDPDWQLLRPEQIELLENWVSEQGGGLIVVAGPVHAGRNVGGWTQEQVPAMQTIRNLYPIEFLRRLTSTDTITSSNEEPIPLDFTREGREADFLGLTDSASSSRQAWNGFPGVYSYLPIRGIKPGATLFARLNDSQSGERGDLPPYLVGQFYGSGSVFYLGSGEIWRLRTCDENYFSQFYTKLIRHVSQGRLLRGSQRGVLLVGQDRYLLGNSVEVRAQLSNSRLEPLSAASVPLQILAPGGITQSLSLRADPLRRGAFVGQFPALLEGSYRLELPIPESDNERLVRRIHVKVPELERENPQRNDELLSNIANQAGPGGRYYRGLNAIFQKDHPLVDELQDRTTTIIQPEAPDPQREETWMRSLMFALCGFLCLEWILRRFLKLA